MLCEKCQKKPAAMRLTKIINNKKHVMNLCQDCARETSQQLSPALDGIGSILSGLMGFDNLWTVDAAKQVKSCPVCGMTQSQITQNGKMGCAECYNTFLDELRPLLRKIHGNCLHKGSQPVIAQQPQKVSLEEILSHAVPIEEQAEAAKTAKAAAPSLQAERETLHSQMKDAIAREDFERAAQIRDRLKDLEQLLQEGGEHNG